MPDYPISEIVSIARTAEDHGFGSVCVADEIYYRDPWITATSIATNTKKIGLGIAAVGACVRPPVVAAQALATLDEVSQGRAFGVVSTGNLYMLEQLGIKFHKPVTTVREAIEIMRMVWKNEPATYQGKIFNIRNATTSAKSPRQKIPLYVGAIGGPQLFILSGEIADGVVTSWGGTKEYYKYVQENVKSGALKTHRAFAEVEMIAGVAFGCATNSEDARNAVRPIVTFYAGSLPSRVLSVQNVNVDTIRKVNELLNRRDFTSAIKATDDDTVDKLALYGSPDEIIEKIEKRFLPYGFKRILLLIPDNVTYKKMGLTYRTPSLGDTIALVKEKVMAHL
jgi:5,10-methylenetetrahydromethanopterin reductase